MYDLYDLEDEIEATEPKDDLDDTKSFLSTDMKTIEINHEEVKVNDADHEKI